jgi:hypothetical protein
MAARSARFRRYLLLLFVAIAAPLAATSAFVIAVDPLWIAPFDTGLAHYYCVKDERQNKTDKLAFAPEAYDSVLIGSSRVNNDFDFSPYGLHLFRYGLSGAFPQELKGYLDHFAREKGVPKTIIFGADFYGTALPTDETLLDSPPETYVDRVTSFGFRFRNILSWHVIDYARQTLFGCAPKPGEYGVFTKDGRMHVEHWPSAEMVSAKAHGNMEFFGNHRYGDTYVFNPKLATIYRAMRDAYPNSKFIVFATPETALMHRLIFDTGRFEDYARWLGVLVDVFGEIYDFNGINSVSIDLKQWWYDGQHIYPELTGIVYDRLLGGTVGTHPDFGVKVTKATLLAHIEAQRATLQAYVAATPTAAQ